MSEHFDRELFERAFHCNIGGCRRTCQCGHTYFDCSNSGWTWEDGELEQLKNDPKATGFPYMISCINLEGKEYVVDCNCWVERAKAIANWLAQNDTEICNWFNLRKQQALAEAKALPEVNL